MTHHRSHAILMPRGADWDWYEAMNDYIRRFRPTLTQSADDAVSFRGKSHTVTVIHPASWNRAGSARQPGQEDDIIAWLKDPKNRGQATFEIDTVEATDPAALRYVLAERVMKSERYGGSTESVTATPQPKPKPKPQPKPEPKPQPKPEEQRFKMVWPTDYKVYTQRFGMRPEYYRQFGLPGHEGVDIRAPNGAKVVACADGVVSQVGWRRPNHPYGYAVRIRHKRAEGEYVTIYAHLQDGSAKVKVGDTVTAGQLVGLGDSTGNVSGAHLHLTLKKIGAKNGGFGEIINPEPFFIDAP